MTKHTHSDLCAIAVKWLKRPESRKGPNCHVAISETSSYTEIPDAVGYSKAQIHKMDRQDDIDFCTVVEVKVSRADFLKDASKPHRVNSEEGIGDHRYYMCPKDLIKKEELPAGWGLLYVNDRGHIKVIATASKMKSSRKNELYLLVKIAETGNDPEWVKMNLKDNRAIHRRLVQKKTKTEEHNRKLRSNVNELTAENRKQKEYINKLKRKLLELKPHVKS